jgi:hypothetical protein
VSPRCPACVQGAKLQRVEFNGGYLSQSRDYVDLLHCNFCGDYFKRMPHPMPLRRVPAAELREHRRVS